MRVAYVGPFWYSLSHANSLRVAGVSAALASKGIDVEIGSAEKRCSSGAGGGGAGVSVSCLDEFADPSWPKWRRVLRGFDMGDKTARWIDHMSPRLDCVILYGTPFGYLRRLIPLLKARRVPLVLDVVEWYEPSHMPGGKYGPFALANEYSMRVLAKQAAGVIAISRYLERYFLDLGLPTIRIPPLFSESNKERPLQFRDGDDKTHFVYAGSPGVKDEMRLVMKAFLVAAKRGMPIRLHLVGLSQGYVSDVLREHYSEHDIQLLRSHCVFYGRVENSVSRSIVSSCDFSLLLRPDLRYSRAGFPSKVGESLTLGTPMVANLSSNLDEVLIDGRNSLVVDRLDVDSVFRQIERATGVTESDLAKMKDAARCTAGVYFSPEIYGENLKNYLEGLQ